MITAFLCKTGWHKWEHLAPPFVKTDERTCTRCGRKEVWFRELGWIDIKDVREIKKSFEF